MVTAERVDRSKYERSYQCTEKRSPQCLHWEIVTSLKQRRYLYLLCVLFSSFSSRTSRSAACLTVLNNHTNSKHSSTYFIAKSSTWTAKKLNRIGHPSVLHSQDNELVRKTNNSPPPERRELLRQELRTPR